MMRRSWAGAVLCVLLCTVPLLSASAISFAEGEVREADLGENVCITALLPPGNGDRVLHIRASEGVTLCSVREVNSGEGPINTAYYTVVSEYLSDGCDTEIHFAEWFSNVDGLEVAVDVHLNDAAATKENPVSFRWDGEERNVRLCTHGFRLFRGVETGNGENTRAVGGIRCCLYDAAGKKLTFSVPEEGKYRVCPEDGCTHSHHVSVLRTGEAGFLTVEGLSAGSYTLCETHLPRNADASAQTVHFLLTEVGGIESEEAEAGNGILYLVEKADAAVSPGIERDPLRFYIWGIRILSVVLFLLLAFHRSILRAIG